MNIISTPIADLIVIEPDVFIDDRGYFFESYNADKWPSSLPTKWVQDNESKSQKGVLRGLHYQTSSMGQAKLVRAVVGDIFDVAVDIRPDSSTYRQWYGTILSDKNKHQMYIPRGFAHGFLVLSDSAIFGYKCDNFYSYNDEGGIAYDDPILDISWPVIGMDYILSPKDCNHPNFGEHIAYY